MDIVAPLCRPNLFGVLTHPAAKQKQSSQTGMGKKTTKPAMSQAGLFTKCLRKNSRALRLTLALILDQFESIGSLFELLFPYMKNDSDVRCKGFIYK